MKALIKFTAPFLFLLSFSWPALSEHIDSCYTLLAPDTLCCNEDIFDSTNSSLDTCSLVPKKQNMVSQSTKTQTLINNHKTNIRKPTTNQQQKQYVFWGSLWSAVKNVFDFVTAPVSPVWGAYEEKGQRTTGPYTVFQQHQGFQIDRLRTKIQNTNDPYFKFYTHIYENALTGNSQNPDSL